LERLKLAKEAAMSIDWIHFTPWRSLAGGLLLGVATAMFLLLNGRVLGISGIAGGLLRPGRGDALWRVLFLAGLVASPWVLESFYEVPAPRFDTGWGTLVAAGLLVGFGTRLGSGCTSGHGVCGVARLSPRSIVATLCFMATGFATVFAVRHLLA
jgi:uncharacterized protein